jgi:hypothetical protein
LDCIINDVGEGVIKNKITILPAQPVTFSTSNLFGMWRYLFGMNAIKELSVNNPIGFTSGEDAATVKLLRNKYYKHLIILGRRKTFEICTHELNNDFQKARFDSGCSIKINEKSYNAYIYMCPSFRYDTEAEKLIKPFEICVYEYNSLQDNKRVNTLMKNDMRDDFDVEYSDKYRKIHPDTVLLFHHIDMKNPRVIESVYCFATFRPKRKAELEFRNNKPCVKWKNGNHFELCTANRWNEKIAPSLEDLQGNVDEYINKRTKLHGGFSYGKIFLLILSGLLIIALIIVIICICINKNIHLIKFGND